MTTRGAGWNEANLSELPEVEHLQRLGYEYVAPDTIDNERESPKEVVLTRRLSAALKRLNPWLSVDNVQKAVRAVTHVHAGRSSRRASRSTRRSRTACRSRADACRERGWGGRFPAPPTVSA